MIINFHIEATKRRDRTGKLPGPMADGSARGPRRADRVTFPVTECGSGWYHEVELKSEGPIRSHRDWD